MPTRRLEGDNHLAKIALKVDVDTLRGTQEGIPRLLRLLERHQAQATFLFSMGPDHTGWALRRVFRPGFLTKVSRTSVVKHYGLKTLSYGVLWPAPDIGKKAATFMRDTRQASHECGIHTWDHVLWQDNVRNRDEPWTRHQMGMAYARYLDVFGERPSTHGAAGWQMNATAFRQLDEWGMAYASDGRGSGPYRVRVDGQVLQHIQLPTTLPTLDELLGSDDVDEHNVAKPLLALTESSQDQVFTLHAELEGGLLAPVFDALLSGWRAQGHQLVPMATYFSGIDPSVLPVLPVSWGQLPGRSGELIVGAVKVDGA
jgi:peptidoglycan/xylan/chitin deacetylase (PgdA/CDA1 family)